MKDRLADFVTSAEREKDFRGIWRLFVDFCGEFGVDNITCGFISPDTGLEMHAQCPEGWLDHYRDMEYDAVDPVLARCMTSAIPFTWYDGSAFSDLYEDNGGMHGFYQEASKQGYIRGLNIPVRDRDDRWVGGVSLSGDWTRRDMRGILNEHGDTLVAASLYAHNWLDKANARDNKAAFRITGRQRELLLWLSTGLQYDQAAYKMSITIATVDYHMGELKRRLGVRTRREILPKALRFGLVNT